MRLSCETKYVPSLRSVWILNLLSHTCKLNPLRVKSAFPREFICQSHFNTGLLLKAFASAPAVAVPNCSVASSPAVRWTIYNPSSTCMCVCVKNYEPKRHDVEWEEEVAGGGQNQQISSDFILRNFVIRPDMCGPPFTWARRRSTQPSRPRTRPDQTKQQTVQHVSSAAYDFHFQDFQLPDSLHRRALRALLVHPGGPV